MWILKHLFIPLFRRTSSIKKKPCRMNHFHNFAYFIGALQKFMINWRRISLIISQRFILVWWISYYKIKFHNHISPYA